ncbi:SDR family oxidoreductase [candidate division KSB1 bacterium]|nr:SDR family oxidoreductase [candidate division KSB1 bacterium]
MKQVALITGGAKRIGKAIAIALAERGFDIALHYQNSEKAAEETASDIRKLGVECVLFRCDLSDMQAVSELIPSVQNTLGQCDLLVNNASIFERAPLLETSLELMERTIQINLKAPIVLSKAFAKDGNQGHIINLLDTKITVDRSPYFIYTLTKKAIHDFTRMAAVELGPHIRVNGIAPGLILPSVDSSPEDFERMGEKTPLQMTGDPSNIIQAVLYLLDNLFVTGECLFVDGGEHLNS